MFKIHLILSSSATLWTNHAHDTTQEDAIVYESIGGGVPAESNITPDGSALILSMCLQKIQTLVLDI